MVLRVLFAILLAWSPFPVDAADSAVVLMYHRFGEDRYPATNVRVDQFEGQLAMLRDEGYTVVPLADVLALVNEGKSLPERAVAITVDDAYRSTYDVAFPRLEALGMPFTVFVSTDAVDEGSASFMSWAQMRDMAAHRVTFANHGAAHVSYIERRADEPEAAWLARVRADVEKGARRLSEELEVLEGAFAYPYGEYTTAVAGLIRDMGYVSFGQHSGAIGAGSDERALPRFPVAEAFADLDALRTKLSSLPLRVSAEDPWEPVTHETRPSVVVTLAETDADLARLGCYVGGHTGAEIVWLETNRRFEVRPFAALDPGRHRVNCTAPRRDGRYEWFSHPWFVESFRGEDR